MVYNYTRAKWNTTASCLGDKFRRNSVNNIKKNEVKNTAKRSPNVQLEEINLALICSGKGVLGIKLRDFIQLQNVYLFGFSLHYHLVFAGAKTKKKVSALLRLLNLQSIISPGRYRLFVLTLVRQTKFIRNKTFVYRL